MNGYRNNDWTRPPPIAPDSPRNGGPSAPAPADANAQQAPARMLAPPLPQRRKSRSSSSRHSSSSRKKLRRMKFALAALLTLIVIGAVIAVFGAAQLQRFRGESQILNTKIAQLEQDLAKARDRVTEMNNDLRILLANRIPGISEISFSRPMEVNNQYVRNVTFVRAGVGDNRSIRFSAVLENARSVPVLPQVNIVLFDESGLQTGAVTLDKEQAGSDIALAELEPGETRQYSGEVAIQRQAPSRYFIVEAR